MNKNLLIYYILWTKFCSFHPNSYDEALTPNVTIGFYKVIKVKLGHNGRVLIQ